jgi:hypothetical protein
VDTEQLLLRFGPFGVSVCDGPYGIFRWQRKNVYVIELTDRCLRGSRSSRVLVLARPRGGVSFEIPYAAIISTRLYPHPARLGLMQVLEISYGDAQGARMKSIAAYNGPAASAFAILQRYAPRR